MEWTTAARHEVAKHRLCVGIDNIDKMMAEAERMAKKAGHRRVVRLSVKAACVLTRSKILKDMHRWEY